MARQSASEMSSIGRPTWPSTPPASFTRMSIRPRASTVSRTTACTAARLLTSRTRTSTGVCRAAASAAVSSSSAFAISHAITCAPRFAKASAIARPNPCAAPVTTAVRPSNRMCIDPGLRTSGGELRQVVPRLGTHAAFDLTHDRHESGDVGDGNSVLVGERDDRTELRVALGFSMMNRDVTPDAGTRLRGAPVELDHRVERSIDRAGITAGSECRRIVAVESHDADAFGGGDGHHLSRERGKDRTRFARAQHIDDGGISQSGREQYRAVTHLAPEIAPDVVGSDRGRLEMLKGPMNARESFCAAAVEFADHDRAAATEVNDAGCHHIGAEVDERAQGALGAGHVGDDELVESVLQRHDDAAGREVTLDVTTGALRVERLDAQEHRIPRAREFVRCERAQCL